MESDPGDIVKMSPNKPKSNSGSPTNKQGRPVRKHSSDIGRSGFFSTTRTIAVDFAIPNNQIVSLNCIGNNTVRQIKLILLDKVRDLYPMFERVKESELLLTYTMGQDVYEICDMFQTFQTLQVVKSWTKNKVKGLLDVRFAPDESNEVKQFNGTMTSLMGVMWGKYGLVTKSVTEVDDEVMLTRRKLTNVRRRALSSRIASNYAMEPLVDESTLPSHIAVQVEEERFSVCIYGPTKSCRTMSVKIDNKPDKIINDFFNGLTPASKTAFGLTEDIGPEQYVLKACGLNDYIWGDHRIIDFVYIRQSIARRNDPHLALCLPPDENKDLPRPIHDPWYLVDESTGVTEDHQQLTLIGRKKNHNDIIVFSLWDMARKFRIKVLGIDFLVADEENVGVPERIYVEMSLYRGTQRLAPPVTTDHVLYDDDLRWYTWMDFDIQLRNLPREARLNVNIIGVFRGSSLKVKNVTIKEVSNDGEQHVILRWANMQLLNHRSVLCTGKHVCKTWPMLYNEDVSFETHTGTTAPNQGNQYPANIAELFIELDTYMHPVVFPSGGWKDVQEEEVEDPVEGSEDWKILEEIIMSDALTTLTEQGKEILRKYRSYCSTRANSLPKVLQSVKASDLESVVEMHFLLSKWPPISLEVALELLDSQYVDEKVRTLAVTTLSSLSDNKLLAYLLQLTQALKFEPYHDSSLARFLLTRALQSKRIGHFFFWFLRSEIENPHVVQRYSILLEAYLRGCGLKMLEELFKQTSVVTSLKSISSIILMRIGKSGASGSKTLEILREELKKVDLPDKFQAHFDPRTTLGRLIIDKCKVMDSKKKPLWLEFENADATNVLDSCNVVRIIFKQGDDLRQDMLTLQMLSLMGQLWNEEGLDLHLLPYGCLSTGLQVGIIQIVPHATTVAKIQKEFGGLIRGTFKDEVLKKWLERKNPSSDKMEEAIKTFMLSCAGYCVATYVLGIGDRHNDNIMVTESGNLFHIDFGHFLGNTKRFYGIQRERVPFVLTPDFVYVMGAEESAMFKSFKDASILAYLVIRRHAALFINLFHMMKATGIPELSSVRDIQYLQNVLVLDKTEEEARTHFHDEIIGVLRKSWTVQVNWMMHRLVHSSNSS